MAISHTLACVWKMSSRERGGGGKWGRGKGKGGRKSIGITNMNFVLRQAPKLFSKRNLTRDIEKKISKQGVDIDFLPPICSRAQDRGQLADIYFDDWLLVAEGIF